MLPQRHIREAPVGAEHEVGVVRTLDVAGGDAVEVAVLKPEDRCDAAHIGELGLVHEAVRDRDVEQAVDEILEQRRLVAEGVGDLAGIGLEAVGRRLREVEQAHDVAVLRGRDLDEPLEGVDLRAQHDAVGLRHLGGKGDETGGKDHVLRRRAEPGAVAVDEDVPGKGAKEGAERPADGVAEPRPAELSPNRDHVG